MLSAAGRALGPKPRKYFSAGNGFHSAAFQIVVTAIKRLSRQSEIFKEIRHHVFDELVTPASGVSRHLL